MGTPEIMEVRRTFRSAVTRDGPKVEQNQPTVFRVIIASSKAAKPILTRMIPSEYRTTVSDTDMEQSEYAIAELILPGWKEPIWRINLGSVDELGLKGGPAASIDELQRRLEALVVPYFIPKDENALALPVVVN